MPRVKFERNIRKQGNSTGISIPNEILDATGLKVNDKVSIYLNDTGDAIIIEKLKGD